MSVAMARHGCCCPSPNGERWSISVERTSRTSRCLPSCIRNSHLATGVRTLRVLSSRLRPPVRRPPTSLTPPSLGHGGLSIRRRAPREQGLRCRGCAGSSCRRWKSRQARRPRASSSTCLVVWHADQVGILEILRRQALEGRALVVEVGEARARWAGLVHCGGLDDLPRPEGLAAHDRLRERICHHADMPMAARILDEQIWGRVDSATDKGYTSSTALGSSANPVCTEQVHAGHGLTSMIIVSPPPPICSTLSFVV